jgi:site-specific DNA-methyltransferase (adenine-specific)
MEINKLYHGDCAVVMQDIPDEYVDLVVTSPPYSELRNYNGYGFDFEATSKQLHRIVKPGGVIVWVVGDQTTKDGECGTSFKQALHFQSLGFNIHDTMIYKKNAIPYPDIYRYYACFEYMFVFSKGMPKTFNPLKDRKNKHANMKVSGTERKVDGSLKEKPCKKRGAVIKEYGFRWNVWDYNVGICNYGDRAIAAHPATFPMALAKDHILSWSNPGDIVLDPMAGAGTTLLMAKETGRNYIGIEISEEYIGLINYRLDNNLYKDDNGITYKRKSLW